jgi:hypothetical protein
VNHSLLSIRAVGCGLLLTCISPQISPAQFTTILNVPPDTAPSSVGSNTQLNLYDTGVIGNDFVAGAADGSSTNVEVNVYGGVVGQAFDGNPGSVVNISGGTFGDFFRTADSDSARISGAEFRIDGIEVPGLGGIGSTVTLTLHPDALLSGTLADGTPFAFSKQDEFPLVSFLGDSFPAGALTLELDSLPPIGPALITASTDPIPPGIRQGQTLRVDAGGSVPDNFNAGRGTTILVEPGGEVGENLEGVNANVAITGGTVAAGFDVFDRSIVTISDGDLEHFEVFDSTVTITGGDIGEVSAAGNSLLTISGGELGLIGNVFGVRTGGVKAFAGSEVHLLGTQFLLVRQPPIPGLSQIGDSVTIETGVQETLYGMFTDGNTFTLDLSDDLSFDYFDPNATLRLTLVPEPSSLLLLALTGFSMMVCNCRLSKAPKRFTRIC